MIFYRVILQHGDIVSDYSHHGTRTEAHAAAKGYSDRSHVRIECINVATHKEGVLALLRGYSASDKPSDTLRVDSIYELSQRGGLVLLNAAAAADYYPDVKE